MAKLGDKRIHNNDFEQFEKCITCNKGFWATSEYELGNWQNECSACRKVKENKEKLAAKKFKKELELYGEKIFYSGKLLGWMYKNNFYFADFEPEFVFTPNIDDKIREARKNGEKNLYWDMKEYFSIDYLAKAQGFLVEHKNGGFTFMGVRHHLKK